MNYRHKWKYTNLTFLIVSMGVAIFLSQYEPSHALLLHLGKLGYVGAFFAGILFVSTFTVAIGAVILLVLAEFLSPVEIGLVAGLGAVLGDLLIFRFIQDNMVGEISRVFKRIDAKHRIRHLFHSKYFSWTLPVVGAIIIASPLPDEIGVSLMGISQMKTIQFLPLSFILNAIGIFLVVSASAVIKP
jgi:hypothetical protein